MRQSNLLRRASSISLLLQRPCSMRCQWLYSNRQKISSIRTFLRFCNWNLWNDLSFPSDTRKISERKRMSKTKALNRRGYSSWIFLYHKNLAYISHYKGKCRSFIRHQIQLLCSSSGLSEFWYFFNKTWDLLGLSDISLYLCPFYKEISGRSSMAAKRR